MKRIVAILVTLCTLVSLCVLPAHAAPQDADPVVFTLGFSTVDLYYYDGVSETRERVWNLSANGVLELAKANWKQAAWGLVKALLFRRYDTLNDAAGKIAKPVLDKMEKLTKLPDGTDQYDLSVSPAVDKTNIPLSYQKNYRGVYLNGVYRALRAEYGRVYVFVSDWREGQIEQARQLDAYIQQVKADSGKEQVSLFGFSQGGETIATYLYYYGDKGDVKKAVLETPAIGGTAFVTAILGGDLNIHADATIAFCEAYMESEKHFEILGKFLRLRWLRQPILSIAYTHVLPIAQYWGGLWDLVPCKDYDRLKAQYLDPVASAPLIAQSDAYHYDVVPRLGEKLRALQAGGMSISVICNTGNPLLFCDEEGDGVLNAENVAGATVADYGKRFSADACAGTVCADPTHRHLSPSHTIDASSCYLPENTWFIDGQFHGQCDWDPYSYDLICKLMLTDELPDVYADPDFPQFAYAQSAADRFAIRFDEGGSFIGGKTVTLTNLSAEHAVQIRSVTMTGSGLRVRLPGKTVLQPGEQVTLTLTGTAKHGAYAPVHVRYAYTDEQAPLPREKVFKTSVL